MQDKLSSGMKVAVYIITLIFIYLGAVSFIPETSLNDKVINTVVPFLLGIIATLVGYYWGNASKSNNSQTNTLTKPDQQ